MVKMHCLNGENFRMSSRKDTKKKEHKNLSWVKI